MNLLYGLWATFGIVLGIVAVISILFSVLIVYVSKLCAVKKDETLEKVQELLSGANCGGCGFNGCADYAKALKEGKATLKDCNSTSDESKQQIAEILSIPYLKGEKTFAVVHCAGGINATNKYEYVGLQSCINENALIGGSKLCPSGCLGNGTCVSVCEKNAISIVDGVAKINLALCGSCGACVQKCPKKIIELIPKSAIIYIACNSSCKGKESIENCKNSCIGCGICERSCPQNAITMVNNMPVIDYSKCNGCKTCKEKCPRKCIKEI